jgi:hypothetical protein
MKLMETIIETGRRMNVTVVAQVSCLLFHSIVVEFVIDITSRTSRQMIDGVVHCFPPLQTLLVDVRSAICCIH